MRSTQMNPLVRSIVVSPRIPYLLLLLGACVPGAPTPPTPDGSAIAIATVAAKSTSSCDDDPRVRFAGVTAQICDGAQLFFRDGFSGNGRTCGTCHPVAHNFTIDPTFIATLPPSDPLFVAERDPALAGLEHPDLMRSHGLILENLDGFDPDPTVRFVLRSVPHTLALATSVTAPNAPTPDGTTLPPLDRTGWSGDGAPGDGRLADFMTGAITQHYTQSLLRRPGVDFQLATSVQLAAIDQFMRSTGRTSEIDLLQVRLADAGAEAGRLLFLDPVKRCNGCHHNAGANNGAGVNRNFDTGVEFARLPVLDLQGIPHDGGFGRTLNASGTFGNGTFNTPPLIEAADTAPFFHTNHAQTIEEAVAHYASAAFASSPAGNGNPVPLSLSDIASLGRFLRVINASQNCQLAARRATGIVQLIAGDKNQSREIQQTLAELARVEVADATWVLSAVSGLSTDAQDEFAQVDDDLVCARQNASHVHRLACAQDALAHLSSADALLGTGTTMAIGAGSLMF
jgi:cytochrome c553